MKLPLLTIVLVSITGFALAQEVPDIPEPKKDSATVALEATNSAVFVEQSPAFPGGEMKFYSYVGNHVIQPELVKLFGFTGRIVVGFTIAKDGSVTEVKSFSNSGLDYEEELVAAIEKSPRWKNGIQNGIPVAVKYTVPFKFDFPRQQISMQELKKSSYKFSFHIKGKQYSLNEAEAVLGKEFSANSIDYSKSFAEQSEENKKGKMYLIQIKD
ncbi:energy transducer TonB [Mucilaginibacter lutimaris]|uniref:Energy transducer TonB n=1 Tax=Mucilaginibacter lutimaris TaxID=931629 RepID=A0ABW2ZHH7_9SPHI